MVFDGIIFSIVIALFRGGSFKSFADLRLKNGWIFPILLIVQIIIFSFQTKVHWVAAVSDYSFLLIYVVGLFFLWVNRHHAGFDLIMVGVFLNFLVMAANGGRMPVSMEAASVLDPYFSEALKNGLYAKHQLLTDTTWLGFLGDIIPLSSPYPRTQVISVGDVVMNVGVFFFVQSLMVRDKKNKTHSSSFEEVSITTNTGR